MKNFLTIAVLALSLVSTKAATGLSSPVFTNFNAVDFVLDLSGLPTNMIKINPNLVSLTNLTINNITTTNLTVNNNLTVQSNSYLNTVWIGITNFNTYLTTNNFVINGTNVAKMSDLLWTNISNVLQPLAGTHVLVSNLTSRIELTAGGGFLTTVGLSTNLVAGLNAINPVNVSLIRVVGPTTTPTDANMTLSSGGGPGSHLMIENYLSGSAFSITNNTPRSDDPSSFILLSNGDWLPTRRGETLVLFQDQHGDWVEVGRGTAGVAEDALWQTNVGSGSISPKLAPTLFTLNTLGSIGIGRTNVFYDKDIGIFHRADLEGNRKAWINIGAANKYPFTLSDYGGEWWANAGTNDSVMCLTWLNLPAGSGTQRDHVWTAGSSGNFFYYQTKKDGAATFEVNGETGDVTLAGQINFGFALTNILSVTSGGDLNYLNDDSEYAFFNLISRDGLGGYVRGYNNGGYQGMTMYADDFSELAYTGGQVTLNVDGFRPSAAHLIPLGTAGIEWQRLNVNDSVTITPFLDGTNYSEVVISHTGTNGAVVVNSRSSGTAGDPREFKFSFNGSQRVGFELDGGVTITNDVSERIAKFWRSNGLSVGNGATEPIAGGILHKFQITHVPDTNSITGPTLLLNGNSGNMIYVADGAYTMTSTPTLQPQDDGTTTVLFGTSNVNTVTLQDEATLPGSGLKLKAATRTLASYSALGLVYLARDGKWHEISWSP